MADACLLKIGCKEIMGGVLPTPLSPQDYTQYLPPQPQEPQEILSTPKQENLSSPAREALRIKREPLTYSRKGMTIQRRGMVIIRKGWKIEPTLAATVAVEDATIAATLAAPPLTALEQLLMRYNKDYKPKTEQECQEQLRQLGEGYAVTPAPQAVPVNPDAPPVAERKINMGLALAEGEKVPDHQLNLKVSRVMNAWQELFKICYGVIHARNDKRWTMMRVLCKRNKEELILGTMVEFFLTCMTDKWFTDRRIIPSLDRFCKDFERFAANGMVASRYMSGQPHWYLINKAGVNAALLGDNVLMVAHEMGQLYSWMVKNGSVTKAPLSS